MKYRILAFFIVLLIFLPIGTVNALEIHRGKISLQENGDALVRNLFSIDSTNRTTFFVTLIDPQSIVAFDEDGDLDFSLSGEDILVDLRENKEIYSFTVDYLTNALTSKNGSEWTFSYNFYKLGNFDESQLTVILPPGSRLLSQFPGGITYLDNNKINIDFAIDPGEAVTTIEAKYTFSQLPQPDDQENNFFLIAVIGIIIAVVIVLVYFFFHFISLGYLEKPKKSKLKKPAKHEEKFSPQQKDILKTLTANEEKITHELFKHKEEGLTQKELALETGLPKSTLSRTLKKLETKTLVEIKEYGITKKIMLTKWFLEK